MLFVGLLVMTKRAFFSISRLVSRIFFPIGRIFISFLVIPAYGLLYGVERQMSVWYRPAKNRFMFFLSNRYSVHGIVLLVAFVAIGVNLQFGEVRAEWDDFGKKSLLYNIVTQEPVQVIEEYADYSRPGSAGISYLGDSTLRPAPAASNTEEGVPVSSVLGEGVISTPVVSSTATADSVAPRETTITYKVLDGDTLSTVAHKFAITLDTLLWANNLTVRSVIKPGDNLSILPVSGVSYTVKKGDTVLAIAKKYSASADDVLVFNKIQSGSALTVGSTLIVPGGEFVAPPPVKTVRPIAVKNIFTAPSGTPKPAGGDVKPALGRMLWPSDGHYVVRGLSWYHTGLDIDCDGHADGTSTATNYAAADGIVQFAGVKGGYGNAVEINHGNGITTRYGHFHQLYVKVGQQVTAGTPLGRCGSTGNSTGTHLHFEVIIGGKFKNPYEYLR